MFSGLKKNEFTQKLAAGAAILGAIGGLGIAAESASAQAAACDLMDPTCTLVDGNSQANFDFTGVGFEDWLLTDLPGGETLDFLFQQTYYFKLDNEWERFDSDYLVGLQQIGSDRVEATFQVDELFTATFDYTLFGGPVGCCQADVTEAIALTNLSGEPLSFKLLEYTDYEVNGTAGGDTGELMNPNFYMQTEGGSMATISQDLDVPVGEVALFPALLNKIGNGEHLADVPGPLSGDVTFGWQWEIDLTAGGPGSSVLFSKDKNIKFKPAPEPGTVLGLLGIGALGLGLKRKKQA